MIHGRGSGNFWVDTGWSTHVIIGTTYSNTFLKDNQRHTSPSRHPSIIHCISLDPPASKSFTNIGSKPVPLQKLGVQFQFHKLELCGVFGCGLGCASKTFISIPGFEPFYAGDRGVYARWCDSAMSYLDSRLPFWFRHSPNVGRIQSDVARYIAAPNPWKWLLRKGN